MHSGGASLFGLETAEMGRLPESPQYQPPPSLNTTSVQTTARVTSQLDHFNALLHVYTCLHITPALKQLHWPPVHFLSVAVFIVIIIITTSVVIIDI